jgi:hypothetical protein
LLPNLRTHGVADWSERFLPFGLLLELGTDIDELPVAYPAYPAVNLESQVEMSRIQRSCTAVQVLGVKINTFSVHELVLFNALEWFVINLLAAVFHFKATK